MKLSDLSLLQREELFKTLRISITHHSNAIEGISLSYGETKTLLETGKTAHNKPIDEQLIVLGFAADGNGRIGRLLMSFQCIQNNLIPPLIENENRSKYLECLNAYQNDNNLKQFVSFLEYCQGRSLGLIKQIQQNSFAFSPNIEESIQ